MEQQLIQTMVQRLRKELTDKFGLTDEKVNQLQSGAMNTVTSALKTYVMKNGTSELESVITGSLPFSNSKIKTELVNSLTNEIQKTEGNERGRAIAVTASENLVGTLLEQFKLSGKSNDLDGIASFLGIDKNLLKMANSPAAKLFGKFF